MARRSSAERARLLKLDAIGRQAVALADIRVLRLMDIREQVMAEIRRRQYNPDISSEEIIEFASRTPDALAPDPSKIKVFERF